MYDEHIFHATIATVFAAKKCPLVSLQAPALQALETLNMQRKTAKATDLATA